MVTWLPGPRLDHLFHNIKELSNTKKQVIDDEQPNTKEEINSWSSCGGLTARRPRTNHGRTISSIISRLNFKRKCALAGLFFHLLYSYYNFFTKDKGTVTQIKRQWHCCLIKCAVGWVHWLVGQKQQWVRVHPLISSMTHFCRERLVLYGIYQMSEFDSHPLHSYQQWPAHIEKDQL